MAAQNPTIFGVGIRGRAAAVSAQRRVNCYVEVERFPDRSKFTLHGLPGLTEFADLGATPIRGMTRLGVNIYAAHRGNLYQIRNDGVATDLGNMDTSEGRVQFANNNDYIMLVDGTSGYSYRLSTSTFAKITDPQFPANPTSVTFLNGRFLVSQRDSEQFDMSALDDPTAYSGTDFDLAYADPDELLRVWSHSGVLVMLGPRSLEYWAYVGAADFPFARIAASQYGWGLAAVGSIAPVESYGMALLERREGGLGVCKITGTEPELVTPPDLVHVFDEYQRTSTVVDAVGASFSIAGHAMYQISFPMVPASWMFDTATGVWSERKSYSIANYRGLEGIFHNGAMFWGDFSDGKIWKMDPTVWIEGQDASGSDRPVEFEVISEHIHAPLNRLLTLHALQIDMSEGVGEQTGQGLDPQVMLRISRDKGNSYGDELWKPIGKAGEYKNRVRWTRLGQARDFVIKCRITDPVPRVITGEAVEITAGAH